MRNLVNNAFMLHLLIFHMAQIIVQTFVVVVDLFFRFIIFVWYMYMEDDSEARAKSVVVAILVF